MFSSEYETASCKSLMYKRNNKGPRTEPWGTPGKTGNHLEKQPLITTNCSVSGQKTSQPLQKRLVDKYA